MIKGCKKLKIVVALLLVLAVLGGAVLFHFRSLEDRSNTNVSIVMEYYDLLMLESDGDISAVVSQLAKSGLNAVIFTDSSTINSDIAKAGGVKCGFSPISLTSAQDYLSTYTVNRCDFPLLTSYSLPPEGSENLARAGITVALRYDLSTGNIFSPENFDPNVTDSLLVTSAPYEFTAGKNGYDFSDSVGSVAQTVNTDGVRAVMVPTLLDTENGVVKDPQVYADYISQLCGAIHELGFDTGSNFYSAYKSSPIASIPTLFVFFGVCAAVLLFVNTFKPLSQKLNFLILILLLLFSGAGFALHRELCAKFLSVLVRIALPCLAFYMLTLYAGRFARSNGNYGLGYAVVCSAALSCLAGLIILCGELTANLLLLNAQAFSGLVSFELTFFVDIVVCAYVIYITFRHIYKTEDTTAGEYFGGLWYSLWNHATRTLAIILAVIVAVILYFLALRDGCAALGESVGASWYKVIGCSPRIMQYLISYPCGALGLLLCSRRMRGCAWIFIFLSSATVFSMNRMFSTALEPISRSFAGALVSCLLGFIVSVVICGVVTALLRAFKFRHEREWWNREN